MAYPANIAPGTDPTPYDVVGVTNNPLFVLLDGFTYATVVGALSRARVDLPYYNGSTTRDILDAAFIGRGPVSVLTIGSAPTNPAFNGDLQTQNDPTPVADEIMKTMQESDPYTHTPPHQNVLAKTVIRYYSGAAGAGDVVGEFVDTAWIGEASKIPQTYGSVPPSYTP